jgi:hypothetical protein
MMRLPGADFVVRVSLAIGLMSVQARAYADDDGDNPGLIAPQHKTASVAKEGHAHQLGLDLQLAVGMRAINTYNGQFCGAVGSNGSTNQAYCLSRTPMTLDFGLTYGVTSNIEAMFEWRIGVEKDFGANPADMNGPRVDQIAPGARFFFARTGRSVFFSTAQVVLDTTGYDGPDTAGWDFQLRNVNGFMFDFERSYSVYLFFGEQVGFKRWLSASLEGGIGLQGRLF